jgi:hypothetical protein
MASAGMLRCLALVRTDVSEELSRNYRPTHAAKKYKVSPSSPIIVVPDDGGVKFLRNVSS